MTITCDHKNTAKDRLMPALEPFVSSCWPFIILSLFASLIFYVIEEVSPGDDITALQRCGNTEQAKRIIAQWSGDRRDMKMRAAFALGLGYLQIPVETAIYVLCIFWCARYSSSPKVKRVALYLVVGQCVAAFCEATRNMATAIMLMHVVIGPWPMVSSSSMGIGVMMRTCAIDFVIVLGTLRLLGVWQDRSPQVSQGVATTTTDSAQQTDNTM